MKKNIPKILVITYSALLFSGTSLANDGDVAVMQGGVPVAATGLRFSGDKLSIGSPNTERALNIVSSEAGANLIRVNPSFGAFFQLRWKTAADQPDRATWLFSVDQLVGTGGFSIIDRLNGDARRFSVHPNGNIGIGTTDPTHKLSVNGGIRAKSVVIDSGWADYVFSDEYKLMPLPELHSYIKENGKLPGLPTAKSVQNEGIDIAEANRLLLEKVEELTLHVISLNERIAELESKNK